MLRRRRVKIIIQVNFDRACRHFSIPKKAAIKNIAEKAATSAAFCFGPLSTPAAVTTFVTAAAVIKNKHAVNNQQSTIIIHKGAYSIPKLRSYSEHLQYCLLAKCCPQLKEYFFQLPGRSVRVSMSHSCELSMVAKLEATRQRSGIWLHQPKLVSLKYPVRALLQFLGAHNLVFRNFGSSPLATGCGDVFPVSCRPGRPAAAG
jgi:hypothetical protein